MRLLNVHSKKLEEFAPDGIPKYAILSHTWEGREYTFQDFERDGYPVGNRKIEGCCQRAIAGGLGYVWIDTPCIDKKSSAELSEAINSMFAWYRRAHVCYVYLADCDGGEAASEDAEALEEELKRCRWFYRGWTLQELLAPWVLDFFDRGWVCRGAIQKRTRPPRKHDEFMHLVAAITNIPVSYLRSPDMLQAAGVAQKMSWAAGRQTTRVEDQAYCLLGIFGINMTMI